MNPRRLSAAIVVGTVALIGAWAAAQQPGFKRAELQRHDLGTPGREVVQVRADFDEGGSVGKHTHPGEEIGYLLEGTLELEVVGKPNVTLKTGDTFFVPEGTIHAARNVGKGSAKVLATYVVQKGKPLATPVK
jgi:quercetin dioxygenase-like cupin family protein